MVSRCSQFQLSKTDFLLMNIDIYSNSRFGSPKSRFCVLHFTEKDECEHHLNRIEYLSILSVSHSPHSLSVPAITSLQHLCLSPQVEMCTFITTRYFSLQKLRCSIVTKMKLILLYLLFVTAVSQEKLVTYFSRHLIYLK